MNRTSCVVLNFIKGFLEANGYPPSVRDISNGCSLSSSSVAQYHLHILEREGKISRKAKISRGIVLV